MNYTRSVWMPMNKKYLQQPKRYRFSIIPYCTLQQADSNANNANHDFGFKVRLLDLQLLLWSPVIVTVATRAPFALILYCLVPHVLLPWKQWSEPNQREPQRD
jgi:hypothetical protein